MIPLHYMRCGYVLTNIMFANQINSYQTQYIEKTFEHIFQYAMPRAYVSD